MSAIVRALEAAKEGVMGSEIEAVWRSVLRIEVIVRSVWVDGGRMEEAELRPAE